MSRKKYKFNSEQKKIYKIDVSSNIVESSSTPETAEHKKAREDREARRASRRATDAQKKAAIAEVNENKHYDVLVQYHQLNYKAIQSAVKELKLQPKYITNTYLVLVDVTHKDLEKIKEPLLKCHFITEKHKEYRVRIAAYRHNAILTCKKEEKKSPGNNANIAKQAKNKRKEHKKALFANRKTKTLANVKKPSHPAAVKDTSGRAKKISKRVKKACRYLAKKNTIHTAAKPTNVAKKPKTKAVQGMLKFAA